VIRIGGCTWKLTLRPIRYFDELPESFAGAHGSRARSSAGGPDRAAARPYRNGGLIGSARAFAAGSRRSAKAAQNRKA